MEKIPLSEIENWFKTQCVADKVWRIDDHGTDNIYLVEGAEKALLIDTGFGTADLAKCVQTLTSLPVMVVNTHGHPDHVGGNFQFANIYAHPLDFELIKGCSRQEGRISEEPSLEPIRAGDVFDLGRRTLEVMEVPGHTPGSIALLDAEHKLLFAGDTNNTLVWLFLDECLPLEVYLQTLQRLNARRAEFTTLLPGHGDALDPSFINEQIVCAQQILSEEGQGAVYDSFAGSGLLWSYQRASIAYDPDKLR